MCVAFSFWIPACAGMTYGRIVINGFYDNRQRSFAQRHGLIKKVNGGKEKITLTFRNSKITFLIGFKKTKKVL